MPGFDNTEVANLISDVLGIPEKVRTPNNVSSDWAVGNGLQCRLTVFAHSGNVRLLEGVDTDFVALRSDRPVVSVTYFFMLHCGTCSK